LKPKESSEKDIRTKKKSGLRENIEAIAVAIVLALFIRTFIVQAFKIPSGSMKNTLLIGDHILVNKFIYGVKIPYWQKTIIPVKNPKRGDIVVFKFPEDPGKDFIKRVIGIGGDVVAIRDKKIYINHKLLNHKFGMYTDPHIIPGGIQPRDNFGPVTVPENSLFVMGDNRDHSYDSRFWGFVDLKKVKGKAFIIYWSWNKENSSSILDYVRWGRIGTLLK
jgi:signal peptidase I